ncbi:MAG: hypothetical protein ACRC5T_12980, partial [Cetobacterium sp.]
INIILIFINILTTYYSRKNIKKNNKRINSINSNIILNILKTTINKVSNNENFDKKLKIDLYDSNLQNVLNLLMGENENLDNSNFLENIIELIDLINTNPKEIFDEILTNTAFFIPSDYKFLLLKRKYFEVFILLNKNLEILRRENENIITINIAEHLNFKVNKTTKNITGNVYIVNDSALFKGKLEDGKKISGIYNCFEYNFNGNFSNDEKPLTGKIEIKNGDFIEYKNYIFNNFKGFIENGMVINGNGIAINRNELFIPGKNKSKSDLMKQEIEFHGIDFFEEFEKTQEYEEAFKESCLDSLLNEYKIKYDFVQPLYNIKIKNSEIISVNLDDYNGFYQG